MTRTADATHPIIPTALQNLAETFPWQFVTRSYVGLFMGKFLFGGKIFL